METISHELLASLGMTGGLAFLMVWLGRRLDLLDEQRARKRCPSCGLLIAQNGSCGCAD